MVRLILMDPPLDRNIPHPLWYGVVIYIVAISGMSIKLRKLGIIDC